MIRDNIGKIRERVRAACVKVNRDSAEVTIVAISKGRTVEQVREAVEAGITDIGENRVQEASLKLRGLTPQVKKHMVGHLQTNKAKDAVGVFDLIQSVDSVRLAEEIDKQAAKIDKIQDILVEIKVSHEETKTGLTVRAGIDAIIGMIKLPNIRIKGLMTIAPLMSSAEEAKPFFRELINFRNKLNEFGLTQPDGKKLSEDLKTISMGMSDDFEAAIAEGSTMIRIGRAIFEE
ncbi:MAG: YggS family pyridoxal phosphate-dependent enzyme [Candidatus Omnitrophica bacterium]|nr:YggS family pyridoxal phosphate-dependent enzyme [Candidatus Omnitrophota bacterium]